MPKKNTCATILIQRIHCRINNEKWRKKCLDIRQEWKWQRKSNYFTVCTGVPAEWTVKPEKKMHHWTQKIFISQKMLTFIVDLHWPKPTNYWKEVTDCSHWWGTYLGRLSYSKEDDQLRWEDEMLSVCWMTEKQMGNREIQVIILEVLPLTSEVMIPSGRYLWESCKEVSVLWIHTATTHTFETKRLRCRVRLGQAKPAGLWKRRVGELSCKNISLSPAEGPG